MNSLPWGDNKEDNIYLQPSQIIAILISLSWYEDLIWDKNDTAAALVLLKCCFSIDPMLDIWVSCKASWLLFFLFVCLSVFKPAF